MSSPTPTDRLRQAGRLLRVEGVPGFADRVRGRAAARIAPAGASRLGVSREDFRRVAELGSEPFPAPLPWSCGEPLDVAFVAVPPGAGSGGHTTIFRIAAALEARGHRCTIYLRDLHSWDFRQHRATIREWWPWLHAEIRDFASGVDDHHALFATGWSTAYWILGTRARGARFYLVQDFEPAFYPAGSEYLLAESTYRFGFTGVTAGRWLSQKLSDEYGMEAHPFDFGCDLAVYSLDESPRAAALRTGIAYYCRPETPRRAHELAVVALELFNRRHPDVPIHCFGTMTPRLPFATVQHGLLEPAALNRVYNRCFAGLVLSATNVSLVPLEMLAAGCTPVVNDAPHNRAVLRNDQVEYAPATPHELADTLSRLALDSRFDEVTRSRAAARSVASVSWSDAGDTVESVIRRQVQHLQQGGGVHAFES